MELLGVLIAVTAGLSALCHVLAGLHVLVLVMIAPIVAISGELVEPEFDRWAPVVQPLSEPRWKAA